MEAPELHGSIYWRLVFGFLKVFFQHLYSTFARFYDWFANLISLGYWNKWVLSVTEALSGQRILELGMGPGHLGSGKTDTGHGADRIPGGSSQGALRGRGYRRHRTGCG